uniref:Glycosyltransferase n=1 Tax=Romanomermis culicivorax TaxID=13658 RepID=A0A915KBM2_ROMCU
MCVMFVNRQALNINQKKVQLYVFGLLEFLRQDEWEKGHSVTNYSRWMMTSDAYEVLYQTDYEPYIVTQRENLPLYDERFVGFGWNKVQHIMELSYASFKFVVLPNVFLVHQPHSPSFDVTKFRSNAVYRRCLKLLKGQIIKDLIEKYS